MERIIYSSSTYVARQCINSDASLTVITFDPRRDPAPWGEGLFFGQRFFQQLSMNVIGVTPAGNDWYQSDDMPSVVEAICNATKGHDLVGYGGSMGAYGLLNFYHDLGLSTVVAVSPQYSPDVAKTDFDDRWLLDRQVIKPRHDKIGSISPIRNGYIIYDRAYSLDRQHVEMIQARHELKEVIVPMSGHLPIYFMNEAELTDKVIPSMLTGGFSQRWFRDLHRQQRRMSAPYLSAIGEYATLRLQRLNAREGCLQSPPEDRGELSIA
ncbi:hypothetical protein [Agrobacterium vitis]|uniref:Alpha/beta hydrolase n=1 Tax=Agrobacterium vitis TaxID=373 RepID=A0A7K1RE33_AGRVI|nr:hypothetical protein [Agrobacterium vitis]MVA56258.1 hypothetical protein [Agrobacterium vitis]